MQLAKLTAAIAAMAAPGNNGAVSVPGAPRGERRATADATPRGKHVCKNHKRLVYHNGEKCMELPKNTVSHMRDG